MKRLWSIIQENAPGLGVVLTTLTILISILGGTTLFTFFRSQPEQMLLSPIQTTPKASAKQLFPDIDISPLSALQGIQAFPGFKVVQTSSEGPELCPAGKQIYGVGFEVKFTLSHNKKGDLPITINSIRIIHKFQPGPSKNLAFQIDAGQLHAAGPRSPYQFFAWLHGEKVEIEEWKSKDGVSLKPKGNELIEFKQSDWIVLRNDNENDLELIEGTIEVTEPGLYLVWLKISGVVGDKLFKRETDHVCIYYKI